MSIQFIHINNSQTHQVTQSINTDNQVLPHPIQQNEPSPLPNEQQQLLSITPKFSLYTTDLNETNQSSSRILGTLSDYLVKLRENKIDYINTVCSFFFFMHSIILF